MGMTAWKPWARCALASFLMAALPGCGERVPLGQVHGTLTLDGQPVPHAVVVFLLESSGDYANLRSAGYCDENGRFTLRCDQGGMGGVVGNHRVVVEDLSLADAPREPDGTIIQFPRQRFPAAYSDPLRTPLRAAIREGDQEIELKMVSSQM